jgi:hypothetical protein
MSTLWSYIRGQLTPTPSGKGDHQIWWSKVKGLLDIVFGISIDGLWIRGRWTGLEIIQPCLI